MILNGVNRKETNMKDIKSIFEGIFDQNVEAAAWGPTLMNLAKGKYHFIKAWKSLSKLVKPFKGTPNKSKPYLVVYEHWLHYEMVRAEVIMHLPAAQYEINRLVVGYDERNGNAFNDKAIIYADHENDYQFSCMKNNGYNEDIDRGKEARTWRFYDIPNKNLNTLIDVFKSFTDEHGTN